MKSHFWRPKIIKFLLTFSIGALVVFFNPVGIFSPVRATVLTLAHPFQKASYFLGREIQDKTSFFSSIASLREENKKLLQENNSLSAQVAILKKQERENENLREQLKLLPREKFDLESCFVIGEDSQKTGNWIMIDKGSSSGLEKGMPVIVSEGILLGKVEEVFPLSSRVLLLSASVSFVNALDLETGAKGIVRGEYGLGMVMDMISQTESIKAGNMVVTSGLGGDFPSGLLIGKIEEVRDSQDRLFQQAVLSSRVRYSELETAYVIKNYQSL